MPFKFKLDFNFLAVGAVVIAGLTQAAQQALTGTPALVKKFPALDLTGAWNYAPLICLVAAGLLVLAQRIFGSTKTPPSETNRAAVFIPSSAKIQFASGNVWPIHVATENISWYVVRNQIQIDSFDAAIKPLSTQTIFTWNLFVSFDTPTTYGQLAIDGNGAALPSYEVKISTQRFAVITFAGDLTNLVLTVKIIK